ncbi:MAG: FkbM family methyltransferase [Halioglobus sp.]
MNPVAEVSLRIPDLPGVLRLLVHGEQDQCISQRIREDGIWEPFETSLLLRVLQPGDVVVDVGANIGYFSVLAASRVGAHGAVFAFEPEPDNFRLLCANAKLNGMEHCIHCVQAALSDHNGKGDLYLSADNFGDHQVYAGDEQRSSVPIVLHHGCEYLADRLVRIDLLKVDTQGSEYQVIVGLMPLLRQLPHCPRILIELTPHALRQAGASGRQLIELLAGLGQPMWIIDHIEGRLALSSAAELALWCDNWDAVAEARGFINILVGSLD